MAIFGDLSDMPLTDVLGMLARHRGTLEIRETIPTTTFRLVIDRGVLKQLNRNEAPLDPSQARREMMDLFRAQCGEFEFSNDFPVSAGRTTLDWPFDRLVLTASVGKEERRAVAGALPHPMIRFRTITDNVMLVEPLSTFWRATAERLAEGVSAQELTRELNLSLADTRFYLHKLRAAGYIVPVRAFQVEPAREERISIASRLLCALFGRGR